MIGIFIVAKKYLGMYQNKSHIKSVFDFVHLHGVRNQKTLCYKKELIELIYHLTNCLQI